jgi:hypothetical protein
MTNKQKITWTGSDEHGYTGTVNGVALYKVQTVVHPPAGPHHKPRRFYLTRRLEPRSYEGVGDTSHTLDEAKADCETDFACNGGRAALHKILGTALLVVEAFGFHISKPETVKRKDRISKSTLADALIAVRTAGYHVRKLSVPKRKTQVGPTFVCEFSDGVTTRMSTCTSLENLDWRRGERLSIAAYQSRLRAQYRKLNGKPCPIDLIPAPPAIVSARFERDGKVLAERNGGGAREVSYGA